ncbi:MAG: phosphatidylglycerophosphatase A [Pseudobdellovibrionaceae bacterium]|nr:phosphatidylglycerophosphatase A [Bdellovibrionales bacterium]USN46502.1 MAG: phosphatidylglycerophosphatase A [Pseudobdellovibrionaceae bacterium]
MTKKALIEFVATWFYLGRISKAPGTVGTLGALPFVWMAVQVGSLGYMIVTFILTLSAIFVADLYEVEMGVHDSKHVVIDEVVGYFIAMTWLPMTWQSFLAAFLLFRFFDILKPFPIGILDKKVKGGLGVVVDDVAAGLITNILLQIVFTKTNWLGYQLTLQ